MAMRRSSALLLLTLVLGAVAFASAGREYPDEKKDDKKDDGKDHYPQPKPDYTKAPKPECYKGRKQSYCPEGNPKDCLKVDAGYDYAKVSLKPCFCKKDAKVVISYTDKSGKPACSDGGSVYAKCGSSISLYISDKYYVNKKGKTGVPDACKSKCGKYKSCSICDYPEVKIECPKKPQPTKYKKKEKDHKFDDNRKKDNDYRNKDKHDDDHNKEKHDDDKPKYPKRTEKPYYPHGDKEDDDKHKPKEYSHEKYDDDKNQKKRKEEEERKRKEKYEKERKQRQEYEKEKRRKENEKYKYEGEKKEEEHSSKHY